MSGDDEKKLTAAKPRGLPVKPICGVVMPISGCDFYTDEHWRRVQRILIKSIELAGMEPRLVWENPEVDVIHSRILQNIYESDVIVCDVSGLNPNVMLELGLRLSTRKPTVVITDGERKPPFDISVYQYHSYSKDLEYNGVDAFIVELSEKIKGLHQAFGEGRYKSFVENFTFEVVEPTEVSVPAEEALREQLDTIGRSLRRLEMRSINEKRTQSDIKRIDDSGAVIFITDMMPNQIEKATAEIMRVHRVNEMEVSPKSPYGFVIKILFAPFSHKREQVEAYEKISVMLKRYEDDVPF